MLSVGWFHRVLIVLALVPIVASPAFLGACGQKRQVSQKIGMAVTVLPQAEFTESVGGEKVDVAVMVPPGASPHTYEPTPSQMVALSGAKMYAKVGSGIEFELVWMDKLAAVNRDMLVIDCSKGVEIERVAGKDGHGEMDPHIWMSPLNAKVMVQNICDGLVQIDTGGSDYYRQNRDAYLQKLTELDRDIRNSLSGLANQKIMVYHPAFGYFAREYDLVMLPIEEGKEPTAADIANLIEEAKKNKIKVIFASPQFNPQSAEVIAKAIGGRVVFIDPLAREYIANLRTLVDKIVQAMESA